MSVANWTEEQLGLVVKRMVDTLHHNPTLSLGKSLYEAQAQYVPAPQHLTLRTAGMYTLHHPRLKAAVKAAGIEYPDRKTGKPGGLTEQVRARQKLAPFRDLISAAPLKTSPTKRMYSAEEVAMLLDNFKADLMKTISIQVGQEVRRLLGEPEIIEASPVEVAEPKRLAPVPARPKLKILICGFEPDKNVEVERRARAIPLEVDIELRFWKDEGRKRLTDGLQWAEHVILMTRWSSHDHTRQIFAHPGLNNVNGSISSAVACIEKLALFRISSSGQ